MVDAPVSKGFRSLNTGAIINGSGDVIRVRHREYIADITGSTGFTTQVFRINPGVASTFPWLSNLAANFEKYRFRSLKFMFESSVATTTSGSVMLAIDLDVLDAPPATKAIMLQMQNVVRSNVWDPSASALPESVPELFVRTGAVPSGADAKTYDAGQLIVGTVGQADTSVIGEAWFEYDVELHTPQATQAAVYSSTVNAPTGSFFDATFAGELKVVAISSTEVRIEAFPTTLYQITVLMDGAGSNASMLAGTADVLFTKNVSSATEAVQILVVRVTATSSASGMILRTFGTGAVRNVLITPVESIPE